MVEGPSRAIYMKQRCGYKGIVQAGSVRISKTWISALSILCRVINDATSAPGMPIARLCTMDPASPDALTKLTLKTRHLRPIQEVPPLPQCTAGRRDIMACRPAPSPGSMLFLCTRHITVASVWAPQSRDRVTQSHPGPMSGREGDGSDQSSVQNPSAA